MCNRFWEYFATRGLERVVIMQQDKRQIKGKPVPIDVRNFFVNPKCEELQVIAKQFSTVNECKRCLKHTYKGLKFWK